MGGTIHRGCDELRPTDNNFPGRNDNRIRVHSCCVRARSRIHHTFPARGDTRSPGHRCHVHGDSHTPGYKSRVRDGILRRVRMCRDHDDKSVPQRSPLPFASTLAYAGREGVVWALSLKQTTMSSDSAVRHSFRFIDQTYGFPPFPYTSSSCLSVSAQTYQNSRG